MLVVPISCDVADGSSALRQGFLPGLRDGRREGG